MPNPSRPGEAGLNSALREPGPICGPLERQTILRSHSRLGWRKNKKVRSRSGADLPY